MTTLTALGPQKAMFQPPATQVRIKLIAHESGQHGITLAKMCEECIGVLLDDYVQQQFLGSMTRITAGLCETLRTDSCWSWNQPSAPRRCE